MISGSLACGAEDMLRARVRFLQDTLMPGPPFMGGGMHGMGGMGGAPSHWMHDDYH